MRLICPNCAAEYEVAPALIPAAGRHVQCTACHTRWFARPEAPSASDEETIIRRLETRGAPRTVSPVAPVVLPAEVAADVEFHWEHATPPGALPEPAAQVVAEPETAPGPTEPGQAPEPGVADAAEARYAAASLRPAEAEARPAPSGRSRLDLTVEPRPAAIPLKPPSRFGHGLAAAAACAALALAAYLLRDPITAAVPAAASALDAYVAAVDNLRERVAEVLPGS